MEILLLCFFVGGFTLGSAFGCGWTLWAMMDRENKARKSIPELMATTEEIYCD
jgi:hypothetical protein